MKPTVYLDSSVPSYWLPQSGDPIVQARHLLTRRWWADELPRFDAFISQVVLEELAGGDTKRAAERLRLVEAFPLLDVDEDVEHARGSTSIRWPCRGAISATRFTWRSPRCMR